MGIPKNCFATITRTTAIKNELAASCATYSTSDQAIEEQPNEFDDNDLSDWDDLSVYEASTCDQAKTQTTQSYLTDMNYNAHFGCLGSGDKQPGYEPCPSSSVPVDIVPSMSGTFCSRKLFTDDQTGTQKNVNIQCLRQQQIADVPIGSSKTIISNSQDAFSTEGRSKEQYITNTRSPKRPLSHTTSTLKHKDLKLEPITSADISPLRRSMVGILSLEDTAEDVKH